MKHGIIVFLCMASACGYVKGQAIVGGNDFYIVPTNSVLNTPAPGLLANDTGGSGPLTAILAGGPAHGVLSLTNDGSFGYRATNNYVGMDTFTYQATDGTTTSAATTAAIDVLPAPDLFLDGFNRANLWPWTQQDGTWSTTTNLLQGVSSLNSYGNAYFSNTWTDYLVQCGIQFSTTNAWGGGIGGRLVDPVNGVHYAAWVYPEGSGGALGGIAALKLIKFHSWNDAAFTTLATLALTNGVGTNLHTLALAFQGSNIFAYFDNKQVTNLLDNGTFDSQGAYLTGGISSDIYTLTVPYTFSFSNVLVIPLAADDNYNVNQNTALHISAPGVLANDTDVYGSTLQANLVSGPANGTLTLTNNGGFAYTPANNFSGTDTFTYQAHDGSNNLDVTTVTITVNPVTVTNAAANNDYYTVASNAVLSVAASGILANDTGSGPLTAILSVRPAHGILTLTNNGSFGYRATNNYTGMDTFTYQATDGVTTSAVATVAIDVLPAVDLFLDGFNRTNLWPWTQQAGGWSLSNNLLAGTSDFSSYGNVYVSNNWTDYLVQGQLQFSDTNAWGGGIGGRLVDPVNGAYYGEWIYPEGSAGGSGNGTAILKILKFHSWHDFSYATLQTVTLTNGVGTIPHTFGLAFQGSNIFAYFDGKQVTNVLDNGTVDGQGAYLNGGISADMWTQPPTAYTLSVSNVVVVPLAANDSYSANQNSTLRISAPGVLANDLDVFGANLQSTLITGPSHGTLTLTNNGGFAYTPSNNFVGVDSFTYQPHDGANNLTIATVTITVNPVTVTNATASNDTYTVTSGTVLNVPASGVLANDTSGNGPLTAQLVTGTAYGSLLLNTNGGFTYTPTNNFYGVDSFTYKATDGQTTSAVATVTLLVTTPGAWFNDNFTRTANGGNILPWINEIGTWNITNNVLFGTCGLNNYGYVYYNANWTNYSVQAQFRFPNTNVWGGAIGGRLNPATGARYDVWVYPENSPWPPLNGVAAGVATLQIIKYESWTAETDQSLIRLPSMGTNWHNVKVAFQGTNVFAYYDGNLITNLVDNGTFDGQPALTSGGIDVGLYAGSLAYLMSVSNVIVSPLVPNSSYTARQYSALSVASPGVLASALDVFGTNLTVALLAGPTNGTLNLSTNGGFTYTPTNGFFGTDGFTFQANDKLKALGAASVTITVLQVTNVLTVTVNNTNRLYGATNPVFTVSYSGFVNGDTSNVLSGVPAITTTATTNSPVGTNTITVSAGTLIATNSNYLFSFTNGILTINPATLTVTASNRSRAYGLTNPVFTVSYSGFVNGDASNVLSGSPTLATSAATNSPAGSYTITNTVGTLSATNYNFSFVNGTLTVTQAVLAVNASNTNRLYGATNPVFTASYSGFLNGDTASVLSGAPSLTTSATTNSPAGSYTITNTIGTLSATNYSFSFTNSTLTINPAALTITASNRSKPYGQTAVFAGTEFSAGGLQNHDIVASVSLSSSGAAAGASVSGSPYSIVVTNAVGTGLTNYIITYVNGTLTVGSAVLAANASNTNRLYGATNPVFTVSYIGFLNGDTASVLSGAPSLTTSATTNSPAGSYTITNTIGTLSATNYSFSFTNGTLTINPAALTVTASNRSKTYGQTLVFAGTEFSTSGLLNSDTVTGASLTSTGAAAGASVNGSPYSIVVTNAAGAGLTNYTITYVNGTLTVGSAVLAVNANDTNRLYGATNPVFTVSYSGFLNGDTTSVLSGAPSLTTSATTNSPAGSYTITNTIGTLSATNYSFSFTNGTLTINPAPLTVTANNTNRIYGVANPVFTASYNGFVNGDTVAVLGGSPSLTTVATTASPAGPYPIIATNGTLSAVNYTFSYVNGTLTVTAAPTPVILSVGLTNGVVTVAWSSMTGSTYGLQSSTNLMGASWIDVPPSLTAIGSITSQTNAIGNVPQQFYRVTVQPNP